MSKMLDRKQSEVKQIKQINNIEMITSPAPVAPSVLLQPRYQSRESSHDSEDLTAY